jgi:hypothetical protein
MRGSFRQSSPTCACLAGALSLLCLTGCRWNEAVYNPDGSRIAYQRGNVQAVLQQLEERHTAVQTVGARLSITLYGTDKNNKEIEHALVGAYLGDKDGNMRLRITLPTNQLILDMGRHGDIVEVNLPRKDRYFRGKLKDLLDNQSQLTLLAHIGNAPDLFFPCASTPHSIGQRITYSNSRETVNVIEKSNYIRRRARRATLSPDQPVVEDLDVYDRFGREVGMVRYFDYQFPALEDKAILVGHPAKDPLPPYPGRIALCPHNSAFKLVLHVEEFFLNEPITPSRFEVPPPENGKTLDLGTALKKSGNLWD